MATGAAGTFPYGRKLNGQTLRASYQTRRVSWEYALFRPDGTRNDKANIKACFQCHKPTAPQDFVFTFSQLVSRPK